MNGIRVVGQFSVTTAVRRSSGRGCSPSPCVPYHFDQNLAGFRWASYLPQECYTGTARAVLRLQAYVKAETVDRTHRRFLGLDSSKYPGEQDERIPVIGIHVLDD